jgi:lysophospholipase L1-like esterase
MQYGWRQRFVVLSVVGCAWHAGAFAEPVAQAQPLADNRWATSFAAFDAADRERAPAPGGVVFVGSSSIRLWDGLEVAFDKVPVIKRGFGGSRLSDCAAHVDRLVVKYRPRQVIVYAGDNDLAEGATPAEVAASFSKLVDRVQTDLPETRITFVSIKPSPLRAHLLDDVREANRRILAVARANPRLDYVDVFTPMLDDRGVPRADLYGPDALHMNEAGYALWREMISARLR